MKEIPLTDILALDILDQEIRELDRQRRDLIESVVRFLCGPVYECFRELIAERKRAGAQRKRAGAHPSDYYKGEQERRIETLLAERDRLREALETIREILSDNRTQAIKVLEKARAALAGKD